MTTTPRAVRSFVRDTVRAWDLGRLIEAAEVIVSELVTNAVKATRSSARDPDRLSVLAPVSVELHLNEGVLRIAVQDGSSEQPVLKAVDDDAENGRGLLLVDVLSVRWDAFLTTGGKVTWAELEIPSKEHA
ncbi:ATP-binding protein [Streptomyces polygonati]|uniref:ATP-binding protein n=1 Tax=Streptomyces polygonati TaxID=1617087 RepID=A0ABV8HJ82_9ACTN